MSRPRGVLIMPAIMELYKTLEELRPDPKGRGTVVTIGAFDGVHLGHLAVIEACLAKARSSDLRALAITFAQHPLEILAPPHAPLMLTSPRRKVELLGQTGVDAVACLPFTEQLAAISASHFVNNILIEQCGAHAIVSGYDFNFGRHGEGDPALITEIGQARGIATQTVAPLQNTDFPISSTRIRNALLAGHVEEASALLGRPFDVEGLVVEGFRRGRLLQFPTANILTNARQCVPMAGVYAIRAAIEDGPHWDGMANVGHAPTFGVGENRIEAHLFDFDEEIYGRNLRIAFIGRIRDITQYESADALVTQLRTDGETARALLGATGAPSARL